ncbi:MAG: hypothetical protein CVU05_07695 [Bacteroidetes bacterium HGW-Bacteroidetes-21]|jgi:methionyl-tRNA formyltransferase|nr:MAG: hypothetical protein CVU05_07695 [Bacteroidetes bacterium HGW-Bacteroidetes-21]
MKIILWVGNEPNQRALANKIHEKFGLAGIITESRNNKRTISISKIVSKIIEKLFIPTIDNAWLKMKLFYQKNYPEYPSVPILDVENINSDNAYEFTRSICPDLIVVSGTRLIKEKMLSLNPSIGIINLHTGLSPYVKGGPNCTNWCISSNNMHLIGNTVMWIDKNIDSGNILTSEILRFDTKETLNTLHLKVMEHAHYLMNKAILYVSKGGRNSVSQSSIAQGKTYYTKEWTLQQKFSLKRNLRRMQQTSKNEDLKELRTKIVTIRIDD